SAATLGSGLGGGGWTLTATGAGTAAFLAAFFALGLAPALKRKAVTGGGGFSAPPKSAWYSCAIRTASESNSRNRFSMACLACARNCSPCCFHFWYLEITLSMGFMGQISRSQGQSRWPATARGLERYRARRRPASESTSAHGGGAQGSGVCHEPRP